jgi:hypothetical protein
MYNFNNIRVLGGLRAVCSAHATRWRGTGCVMCVPLMRRTTCPVCALHVTSESNYQQRGPYISGYRRRPLS